jgi:hypothetical protein
MCLTSVYVCSLQYENKSIRKVRENIDMQLLSSNSHFSQTPVLNDVRDITIARSGDFALISYENKVGSYNLINRNPN